MSSSDLPLWYDIEVPSDGRVEVKLPLPAGSHVRLYVVDADDRDIDDVLAASTTSTDFWDNPFDDEDWNHA